MLRDGASMRSCCVAITLGGGLAWLFAATEALPCRPIVRDLALLIGVALIGGVVGLPFSWWRTFRIEERFGFNRTTMACGSAISRRASPSARCSACRSRCSCCG